VQSDLSLLQRNGARKRFALMGEKEAASQALEGTFDANALRP